MQEDPYSEAAIRVFSAQGWVETNTIVVFSLLFCSSELSQVPDQLGHSNSRVQEERSGNKYEREARKNGITEYMDVDDIINLGKGGII